MNNEYVCKHFFSLQVEKKVITKSQKSKAPPPPIVAPQTIPVKTSSKPKAPQPPILKQVVPEMMVHECGKENCSPIKKNKIEEVEKLAGLKKIHWDKNILDSLVCTNFHFLMHDLYIFLKSLCN